MVEERRQVEEPFGRGEFGSHAGQVQRRHAQDRVGPGDRRRRRFVAAPPRTLRAFGCVRCLGHDVGDVERTRNHRADPVGRPIVEVIGEPQLGARLGRGFAVAGEQRRRLVPAGRLQLLLRAAVGRAVVAAEGRGERDIVPDLAEHPHHQARHRPVARGHRMGRGLQRRIERDAHVKRRRPRKPKPRRRADPDRAGRRAGRTRRRRRSGCGRVSRQPRRARADAPGLR